MKAPVSLVSGMTDPRFVFGVLFALALMPVLLVPIPAMVDYPNHLARMFILSRDGTANAHPFYQVEWAIYPNLAMDLIIPQFARLMSVETATRVFLLISQVLIVTGAVAIERVVKGRVHIAGIVAVMFLYSLPFAWGFMNFEFGLGLALWAIALALMTQERSGPVRLLLHSIIVGLLFGAHFFALGIYGVTLGLYELSRVWTGRASLDDTIERLAILALPAAALLGLMAFTGGAIGGAGTSWFLEFKPLWLFHLMSGYSLTLSAIGVTALLGFLYVGARTRMLRFEPAGVWLLIGFGALYIVLPSRLFDTSFVDLRVLVAAALILPAFVDMAVPSPRWRVGIALCAIGIALAHLASVTRVWTSYRGEYAEMIESFGKLEKSSLVLVGHSGEGDDPPLRNLDEYPIYHAPTLAVHYADAFVPSLFTATGKQPVTARPAYQRLDVPYGGPVPIAILKAIAAESGMTDVPAYIRTWHRDFDYLYLVGPAAPNPIPDLLQELQASSRFVLYRIRKTATAENSGP